MSKNGLRGLIALIMVAVIGFGLFIGWGIGSKWGEIKNIKDYLKLLTNCSGLLMKKTRASGHVRKGLNSSKNMQ